MRLLQPTIILLLFMCIRAGDLAISAGTRDVLRAILYGFVALLAPIALILSLI